MPHLCYNPLFEIFQLSFRSGPRTEAVLTRGSNDLLLQVFSGTPSALILLDLSAPFDSRDQGFSLYASSTLEDFQGLHWHGFHPCSLSRAGCHWQVLHACSIYQRLKDSWKDRARVLNCECLHVFPKQVNVRRIPQRQGGNPFDACSPGRRKLHRRRESSCVGMVGLTGHTLGVHEHACVWECIWNSDTFESWTYFMLVSSGICEVSFP